MVIKHPPLAKPLKIQTQTDNSILDLMANIYFDARLE